MIHVRFGGFEERGVEALGPQQSSESYATGRVVFDDCH
jgi:hypothetical protein